MGSAATKTSKGRNAGPANSRCSWVLLGMFIAWTAGVKGLAVHLTPHAVGYIEQGLLVAFFVAHALVYYTLAEAVFFAAANIVVSNVFENLSVVSGFPFGYYHHNIGPKFFHVPYLVTLIYLGMGYISWMVAQVLLRRTSYRSWSRKPWVAPLVAAFVFTFWDLCIDPIYGTIYRAFTYKNPGVWFGTPGGNYFGWLLTTYLFYLPFSLHLSRRVAAHIADAELGRSYWLQPVVMYLTVAAE